MTSTASRGTIEHVFIPPIAMPNGKSAPPKPLGNKKELAAYMRAMPTRHEQILQVLLQSMGCAREFKQQVEIFGYIADFEHCGVRNGKLACVPFIIEVDGNSHNTRKGRAWDATRDRAFNKNGYSVLRVTNASLERNPRGAIAAVKEMLDSEHGKSKPTVRRFTG